MFPRSIKEITNNNLHKRNQIPGRDLTDNSEEQRKKETDIKFYDLGIKITPRNRTLMTKVEENPQKKKKGETL